MAQDWKWACVPIIVALVSGCASNMHSTEPNAMDSNHMVTVQCTITGTSDPSPCIQEARQICHSDHARLQQIMSRNIIPATQGVDQTPMPITQYVTTYVCS
jgi:hypothetical protein